MEQRDKASSGRNFKHILTVVVLFLGIAAIVFFALNTILPGFFDVLEGGDQQQIEAYIRSFGSTRGMLLAFLLQFIQILSVFFPGGPIQIAIGVVFGTLPGFLICHVSYLCANVLVFFCARRLGSGLDHVFSGDKRSGKLSFISESKHPAFMVLLACMMPLLPNGLVPYIAARTKITLPSFALSVWAGSIPCLLMLNAIGSKLLTGDYVSVILLCAVFAVAMLMMIFRRNAIFAASERFRSYVLTKLGKKPNASA